jgi:hypothetical protein
MLSMSLKSDAARIPVPDLRTDMPIQLLADLPKPLGNLVGYPAPSGPRRFAQLR